MATGPENEKEQQCSKNNDEKTVFRRIITENSKICKKRLKYVERSEKKMIENLRIVLKSPKNSENQ